MDNKTALGLLFFGIIATSTGILVLSLRHPQTNKQHASSLPTEVNPSGQTLPITPMIAPRLNATSPRISISIPTDHSRLPSKSVVMITAVVGNSRTVQSIAMYVNNTLLCTKTAPPYACAWTVPAPHGTLSTIKAIVTDTSNNTALAFSHVTSQ